jgi:hypothetical protein
MGSPKHEAAEAICVRGVTHHSNKSEKCMSQRHLRRGLFEKARSKWGGNSEAMLAYGYDNDMMHEADIEKQLPK